MLLVREWQETLHADRIKRKGKRFLSQSPPILAGCTLEREARGYGKATCGQLGTHLLSRGKSKGPDLWEHFYPATNSHIYGSSYSLNSRNLGKKCSMDISETMKQEAVHMVKL